MMGLGGMVIYSWFFGGVHRLFCLAGRGDQQILFLFCWEGGGGGGGMLVILVCQTP